MLTSIKAPMDTLFAFMPDYTKLADGMAQYKDKNLAPLVEEIVKDIQQVEAALATLDDINMDATIEKIGTSLGIKDTVLKIERKPIQMNVQLNLTMKADDIAKEVFEVAYKMARPGEGAAPIPLGIKNAYVGASYNK